MIDDYARYDAIGLADLVRRKAVTETELLETAIAIADRVEPKINSITQRLDEMARREIAAGLPDGPLKGVPFLVKDLGAWIKGAPSGNGSHLYDGFIAPHDFTIVERYRRCGLSLFGRTASPEFGLVATTEPAAHGPTRNPWALDRSAGGSSGGAAAAVAAGIVPVAHATDGGGSIRIPAAQCGLFGFKPTRARTPAGPLVGEGWGGMAIGHVVSRSVRDSAFLLDLTGGASAGDPYWAPPPLVSYLEATERADPGRLRIALMTTRPDGSAIHPDCRAAVEETAKLCESLGHAIEPAMPSYDAVTLRWARETVIAASLVYGIELRLAALGRAQAPGDIENITQRWVERGRSLSAADYARAMVAIHKSGRDFAAFFQRYDILLSPVSAEPPPKIGVIDMMCDWTLERFNDRQAEHFAFTRQQNATGGPAMSVPLAWNAAGLPIGIQFAADFGRDDLLFALAGQLEKARPWFDKRPAI